MMQSGGAIVEASDIVIDQGKQAAAHFLEAAVADVEFVRGRFNVAGTDLGIDIMDLAERLRLPERPARGRAADTGCQAHLQGRSVSISRTAAISPRSKLDPETGVVEIVSYATVNDFGVLVNPMLVAGQAHGGIAQGIGQALDGERGLR